MTNGTVYIFIFILYTKQDIFHQAITVALSVCKCLMPDPTGEYKDLRFQTLKLPINHHGYFPLRFFLVFLLSCNCRKNCWMVIIKPQLGLRLWPGYNSGFGGDNYPLIHRPIISGTADYELIMVDYNQSWGNYLMVATTRTYNHSESFLFDLLLCHPSPKGILRLCVTFARSCFTLVVLINIIKHAKQSKKKETTTNVLSKTSSYSQNVST